jgi:hypothetical protein
VPEDQIWSGVDRTDVPRKNQRNYACSGPARSTATPPLGSSERWWPRLYQVATTRSVAPRGCGCAGDRRSRGRAEQVPRLGACANSGRLWPLPARRSRADRTSSGGSSTSTAVSRRLRIMSGRPCWLPRSPVSQTDGHVGLRQRERRLNGQNSGRNSWWRAFPFGLRHVGGAPKSPGQGLGGRPLRRSRRPA